MLNEWTSLSGSTTSSLVSLSEAVEHLHTYSTYAAIDSFVTGGDVHGSVWSSNYGYNQYYGADILGSNAFLPEYHAGIDISTPLGTGIHSLTSGVVSRIKPSIGGVYIKPANQKGTLVYLHLSEIDVEKDDVITLGQLIGKSGDTGTPGSYHLHIEWLVDDTYELDNSDPTFPKEISVYTQGETWTATDVTYDLKYLQIEGSDELNSSVDSLNEYIAGHWVASHTQIPNSEDANMTTSLILGANGNGFFQYRVGVQAPEDCSYLSAFNEGDIEFNIQDNVLTISFLQDVARVVDSCGGWFVRTGSYDRGDKVTYDLSTSINQQATLTSQSECDFSWDGVCTVRNSVFYKVD